jgi:transposase
MNSFIEYNHYIKDIQSNKLILTPQHMTYLEQQGFTRKKMTEFANKSERTIYRWNKLVNKDNKDKPKRGRKLKIVGNTLELLLSYDENNNTATLRELSDYLFKETGQRFSQATIFRVLENQDITRKKAEKQYSEQNEEKVKQFVKENY